MVVRDLWRRGECVGHGIGAEEEAEAGPFGGHQHRPVPATSARKALASKARSSPTSMPGPSSGSRRRARADSSRSAAERGSDHAAGAGLDQSLQPQRGYPAQPIRYLILPSQDRLPSVSGTFRELHGRNVLRLWTLRSLGDVEGDCLILF